MPLSLVNLQRKHACKELRDMLSDPKLDIVKKRDIEEKLSAFEYGMFTATTTTTTTNNNDVAQKRGKQKQTTTTPEAAAAGLGMLLGAPPPDHPYTNHNKHRNRERRRRGATKFRVRLPDTGLALLCNVRDHLQQHGARQKRITKRSQPYKGKHAAKVAARNRRQAARAARQSECCQECHRMNTLHIDSKRGITVCTECGSVQNGITHAHENITDGHELAVVVMGEKAYHADGSRAFTPRCGTSTSAKYDPTNHWRDWISLVQGLESKAIPDDIKLKIMALVAALGTALNEVTPALVHFLLRTNVKQSEYYPHAVKIWAEVTGLEPVRFTFEQEALMCRFFLEYLRVWPEVSPDSRKNLMYYPYVIAKIAELLGFPDLTANGQIRQLTEDRVQKQDELWEMVCDKTGWTFIPSKTTNVFTGKSWSPN